MRTARRTPSSRTLKTDYGKKQDCETILEIGGAIVSEAEIATLGIVLSRPPLRAPVLAQHTLGYRFSARPQDRAGYFKALLEVTDLDEFRSAVAALEKENEVVPGPLIIKLEAATAIPAARKNLRPLLAKVPGASAIDFAFAAACRELIESFGETAPTDHATRLARVEEILAEKRARTFALKGLIAKPSLHGLKRLTSSMRNSPSTLPNARRSMKRRAVSPAFSVKRSLCPPLLAQRAVSIAPYAALMKA